MGGILSNTYNNIGFALSLHTEQLARLQEQISTGSRINRASDDPSAAYRVLGLGSQNKSLGNYITNLSETTELLKATKVDCGHCGHTVSLDRRGPKPSEGDSK